MKSWNLKKIVNHVRSKVMEEKVKTFVLSKGEESYTFDVALSDIDAMRENHNLDAVEIGARMLLNSKQISLEERPKWSLSEITKNLE